MSAKLKLVRAVERLLPAAKRQAASQASFGSFFLDPVVRSSKVLSKGVAKYREGLRKADVAAGTPLSKIPGVGRLFKEKRKVPVIQAGKGVEVTKEFVEPRLSAPLVGAQKFVVPILAFEGARGLAKPKGAVKHGGESSMNKEERQVLSKAADLIDRLSKDRENLISMLADSEHKKEAAILAKEMAEKGIIDQSDIDKKAEELSNERDLDTVKKAVSMVRENMGIGRPEENVKVAGLEGELDPMTEYLLQYVSR